MKRFFVSILFVLAAAGAGAQTNMKGFRHMSVGAELGLHGFGVELALPVQKHFIVKAGYNWSPCRDIVHTDIRLNTAALLDAQTSLENTYNVTFANHFRRESSLNAGLEFGMHNYKAMVNYYPFLKSRFYLAGGVYCSAYGFRDENLVSVHATTTAGDWAALNELNDKAQQYGQGPYSLEMEVGGRKYGIAEKDGCGYLQAGFKIDPLKYYAGAGIGRCIPNALVGLQFEVGAMVYRNSVLTVQGENIGSFGDAVGGLTGDVREIIEYADKYPVYPQVTLRVSFRAF